MVDPGPESHRALFRRALSRLPSLLPSNFVSVDQELLAAPRQFSSTDHLSTEAVAAFADGELPMRAHLRAASHLSLCAQCAAEVDAQVQARSALRESRPISMPSTLLGLLSAIPQTAPDEPVPSPPPDGEQPDRGQRGRRKRR